jgi:hypothetical protein
MKKLTTRVHADDCCAIFILAVFYLACVQIVLREDGKLLLEAEFAVMKPARHKFLSNSTRSLVGNDFIPTNIELNQTDCSKIGWWTTYLHGFLYIEEEMLTKFIANCRKT